MRAARVDDNHVAVVEALRKAGAMVQSLAGVGDGVPDLLIGIRGKLALFEIKDGSKSPSRRKLTPDQVKWHEQWAGYPVCTVDCVEAALRMLAVMK